jgi:hypothetical protein
VFNFSAHWDYVKRLGLVDNNLLGMPRKPILAVRQYRFDSPHKVKLESLNFTIGITYSYCIVELMNCNFWLIHILVFFFNVDVKFS